MIKTYNRRNDNDIDWIGGYIDLWETGRLETHLVFTRRLFSPFDY
jgi:hypothetical protein